MFILVFIIITLYVCFKSLRVTNIILLSLKTQTIQKSLKWNFKQRVKIEKPFNKLRIHKSFLVFSLSLSHSFSFLCNTHKLYGIMVFYVYMKRKKKKEIIHIMQYFRIIISWHGYSTFQPKVQSKYIFIWEKRENALKNRGTSLSFASF